MSSAATNIGILFTSMSVEGILNWMNDQGYYYSISQKEMGGITVRFSKRHPETAMCWGATGQGETLHEAVTIAAFAALDMRAV